MVVFVVYYIEKISARCQQLDHGFSLREGVPFQFDSVMDRDFAKLRIQMQIMISQEL